MGDNIIIKKKISITGSIRQSAGTFRPGGENESVHTAEMSRKQFHWRTYACMEVT